MVSLFFSLYIHNNFSACFLSALPRLFDNLCVCFEKAASNVAFDNFHALFCLVSSLHSGLSSLCFQLYLFSSCEYFQVVLRGSLIIFVRGFFHRIAGG